MQTENIKARDAVTGSAPVELRQNIIFASTLFLNITFGPGLVVRFGEVHVLHSHVLCPLYNLPVKDSISIIKRFTRGFSRHTGGKYSCF